MKPFIYKKNPYRFCRLLSALGFVCCVSIAAMAQNLVPNGSFEEGITCPTQAGNVTSECAHWYASVLSSDGSLDPTPDWVHTCSDIDWLSPPEVVFGTQTPAEGEGYAGLVSFSVNSSNAREVIGVELDQPLISGGTYLVEFYVSNMARPEIAIATNKIGFNFSTHQYYNLEAFPINTSHYAVEEIIPLSDEWFLVSHLFTADSAYNYLHIGGFYDDEHTLVDLSSENPVRNYFAIDNVSVTGVLSSGASGKIKTKVKVFPNPAFQNLNIVLPEGQNFNEIRIYDSMGKQVIWIKDVQRASETSISVAGLNSGVYHLRIVTDKATHYETLVKT